MMLPSPDLDGPAGPAIARSEYSFLTSPSRIGYVLDGVVKKIRPSIPSSAATGSTSDAVIPKGTVIPKG
jgi:hypothetical protein